MNISIAKHHLIAFTTSAYGGATRDTYLCRNPSPRWSTFLESSLSPLHSQHVE